jgi:uncharacterized protein YqcC (DUF446 family)
LHKPDKYDRLDTLLEIMQREMQRIGIWESMTPPPADLASNQPFCYDTLHVGQWLQWIFIPRMKAIIEHGAPLPLRCDIHPYAEESLARYTIDTVKLLSLIREIDGLVSNNARSPVTGTRRELLCN